METVLPVLKTVLVCKSDSVCGAGETVGTPF